MRIRGCPKTFIICALLLLGATPKFSTDAHAQGDRVFLGVRVSPFRFHTWREDDPVLPTWGQFGGYVGLRVWRGLSILWGADYASHSVETTTSFWGSTDEDTRQLSVFTPYLCLRLSGRLSRKNHTNVYVGLLAFRTSTKVTRTGAQEDFEAELASPSGLTFMVGGQAQMVAGARLGVEIGLRRLRSRASAQTHEVTREVRVRHTDLYAALSVEVILF